MVAYYLLAMKEVDEKCVVLIPIVVEWRETLKKYVCVRVVLFLKHFVCAATTYLGRRSLTEVVSDGNEWYE